MRGRASRWPLLAFALLGIALGWHLRRARPVEANSVAPPRLARLDLQQPAQTPPASAPVLAREIVPVRVDVKPSVDAPQPDGEAARTCGIKANAGSEPWIRWVDLNGPRIQAVSGVESVPAYAVKTAAGVAVLVANHGDQDAALTVAVRLGRGIYSVERHTFSLDSDHVPCRSECLQSVLFKGTGTLGKRVNLQAGTASVFCVQNACQELGRALQNARTALRSLAGSRPRSFRLIRAPFSEAMPRIEGIIDRGGAAPREWLATRVERATLSLAHAQTLYGNLKSDGLVSGDAGEELGQAFDRLEAGLTAVSVALLDLVPNCEWGEEEPGKPGQKPLSIQLGNYGSRSLRMVKIGVAASEDCRVSPDDPAVFGTVRPGETVKATFMLKPASPDDLTSVRASLSYIAHRAPTHLQFKTQ